MNDRDRSTTGASVEWFIESAVSICDNQLQQEKNWLKNEQLGTISISKDMHMYIYMYVLMPV